MSDVPNAGTAAGEGEVIEKPAADGAAAGDDTQQSTTAAAAASVLSDAADDTGTTAPADWPSDWRERIAKGNDKVLSTLKKYGSVEGLWKKIENQEKLISDRAQHRATPTLPEGATEEQVAEYRKAVGIPESPEGYGVKFAEELKPTAADNALLQDFLRDAHAGHWTPAEVTKAFGWYQQTVARAREQQASEMQKAKAQTFAELRREYGSEKDKNLKLADEFLESHGLSHLLDATLPNGRPVVFDPVTMKQIIAAARNYADEDALYGGDAGGAGGASLDDRIAELRRKSALGTLTPTEDTQYNELLEKRMQRDERRRNRAA